MQLETVRLGTVEIDEASIIHFPKGIPGFEELKRFAVIQPDEEAAFSFLQSVDDAGICFIITNPFWFYKDYAFDLPDSVREELRLEKVEEVSIWTIMSVQGEVDTATINLQAPVVINVEEKLGMQVILHQSPYHTKHKLIASS